MTGDGCDAGARVVAGGRAEGGGGGPDCTDGAAGLGAGAFGGSVGACATCVCGSLAVSTWCISDGIASCPAQYDNRIAPHAAPIHAIHPAPEPRTDTRALGGVAGAAGLFSERKKSSPGSDAGCRGRGADRSVLGSCSLGKLSSAFS